MNIEKPIFIIGTGRCGSTIVFEALATHEGLAWFSQYNGRFPTIDLTSTFPRIYDLPFAPRGEKTQYKQGRSSFNRYLPRPDECYQKWTAMCGEKFPSNYLIGVRANDEEAARVRRAAWMAVRLQGKRRFLSKITGPTRIEYLHSIFPDALFVHVVRDGRAVVNSLLRVEYWRVGGGLERPYWEGGLAEDWQEEWASYGSTPASLAAMQIRTIMKVCEQERKLLNPDQYLEIAYEDFIANPKATVERVLEFCDLPTSSRLSSFLLASRDQKYTSMNKKYQERFSELELSTLNHILGYR